MYFFSSLNNRIKIFPSFLAQCIHTSALSTGVTGDDVMLLSGSGEHLNSKLLPLPSLLDSLIGDNGVQRRDVLLSLTFKKKFEISFFKRHFFP